MTFLTFSALLALHLPYAKPHEMAPAFNNRCDVARHASALTADSHMLRWSARKLALHHLRICGNVC
uniref:Uncharacterized protein n=1 Tax=mine drainage metagenome TaxID=410659 RepID=E6Q2T0_9ZZZZ